jgi:hypothetical protein
MIRIGVRSFVAGGEYTPSDADALAFVNAAAITDETQKLAINNLVTDLKGYSIWTKMKAIYPFVGGTSSTHKWNLKDPRDLDAAFRLVFNGGWTHNSNGAKPNGTNAFANSFLKLQTNFSANSFSFNYYSRTQILNNSGEIGVSGSGLQFSLHYYYNGNSEKSIVGGSYPANSARINNSNTLGFQIGTRTASNVLKLHFNGNLLVTNTNNYVSGFNNFNIYLGAINSSGTSAVEYSNKECAFAALGNGLTDTEAANFYTAVQAYQTTLSRNV